MCLFDLSRLTDRRCHELWPDQNTVTEACTLTGHALLQLPSPPSHEHVEYKILVTIRFLGFGCRTSPHDGCKHDAKRDNYFY